jgi:hypothetical protein
MSPSTLSTELDSLRAGAKVAQSVAPPARRPRARRKKVAESVPEKPSETQEEKLVEQTESKEDSN